MKIQKFKDFLTARNKLILWCTVDRKNNQTMFLINTRKEKELIILVTPSFTCYLKNIIKFHMNGNSFQKFGKSERFACFQIHEPKYIS